MGMVWICRVLESKSDKNTDLSPQPGQIRFMSSNRNSRKVGAYLQTTPYDVECCSIERREHVLCMCPTDNGPWMESGISDWPGSESEYKQYSGRHSDHRGRVFNADQLLSLVTGGDGRQKQLSPRLKQQRSAGHHKSLMGWVYWGTVVQYSIKLTLHTGYSLRCLAILFLLSIFFV